MENEIIKHLSKYIPVAYEPLHKIINSIVEGIRKINERLAGLVVLSQDRLKGDYRSVNTLLCESFVRTIDMVIYARQNLLTESELRQIIEDEYKLGHILTFHLPEQLPGYEANGKTLKEYYPQLISSVDIESEKKRWVDYWNDHPGE